MKNLLLASFLLAPASSAFAEPAISQSLAAASEAQDALKKNPCLQNQAFDFYELLAEAKPLYAPSDKATGAPPRSIILTMTRCEVRDVDHVENKPMKPAAARWFTHGEFGFILTSELDSNKTYFTAIFKRGGAWINLAQLGEYSNTDIWDFDSKVKAVVKVPHYELGGVELPYLMHVAMRPSWSR